MKSQGDRRDVLQGCGRVLLWTRADMAAGVPSLSPVVMVQEAAHDDATIAFLLSQSLLAQQRAEEEAREAQEVVEADLASKEQRLLEELERHRCPVVCGHDGLEEEAKEEEEEEEAETAALVPVQLLFMTSFFPSSLVPDSPCPVSGFRLTSARSGFLWETTPGTFPYSVSTWFDS